MKTYPLKIDVSFPFEGKKYRVSISIYHPDLAGSNYNAFYHIFLKGDRHPLGGSSMREDTPLNQVVEDAMEIITHTNLISNVKH